MKLGAVVLTTGERPVQLAEALSSIRAQSVPVEIVVVLNRDADVEDGPAAAEDALTSLGDDVEVLRPGANLGIPAGRNVGFAALRDRVDAVLFLDDDASLEGTHLLAQVVADFAGDPQLAVVSMRLRDPMTGRTERRHVPRLMVGSPARSSMVTTFLGGASVIRVHAYEEAGGLPDVFFYAHEETSLAWRLLDRGWRLKYRGDLIVAHPAAPPSRHAEFYRLTARNRVLLAHLHLPFIVAAVYVGSWLVVGLLRAPGRWRETFGGIRDGLRMRDMDRMPIRWRTIWVMTRYGRPPIL